MEFNTVQPLEPLATELTGEVVVSLWHVLLHVPVQGGTLATLIPTDFTSGEVTWDCRNRKKRESSEARVGKSTFVVSKETLSSFVK